MRQQLGETSHLYSWSFNPSSSRTSFFSLWLKQGRSNSFLNWRVNNQFSTKVGDGNHHVACWCGAPAVKAKHVWPQVVTTRACKASCGSYLNHWASSLHTYTNSNKQFRIAVSLIYIQTLLYLCFPAATGSRYQHSGWGRGGSMENTTPEEEVRGRIGGTCRGMWRSHAPIKSHWHCHYWHLIDSSQDVGAKAKCLLC